MGPNDTDVTASPDANRVHIFDTTLRDGEQSPGISLNAVEKLEIAQQLARLGVDVIEAGFPIASPGDFEAVKGIAQTVEGPIICGLARTHKGDIDAAWGAVKYAERPRIHTFISTSDIHIKYQMDTDREDVKGQAKAAVTMAKAYCEDVEFSPMDASRSDFEYTAEVLQMALDAGATVINVPDTVGYATPEEYAAMWKTFYELVPDLRKVETSVHCHDDLGLAVANSYAGVIAGCRQVECAVNGLGERAGNCSLEEIAMLFKVRQDVHGFTTGINTREIARSSRLVSRLTGYPVQPNKAIVGRNAFAHESGIHQDGMLKHTQTYEIMTPESVGVKQTSLVMGKHSGRHAFVHKLRDLGYELAGNQLEDAFVRFKALADRKKHVYDEDIEALVDEEIATAQDRIKLVSLSVIAGTRGPQRATMKLDIDGRIAIEECEGNGPVDATFNCIKALIPHDAVLELYQVHAVTEGTDAQAEVSVRLSENDKSVTAKGADPDTLVASANAYLGALNKLMVKRQRTKPEAMVAP
jgi:2-isopropylmalate synthase